MHLQRVSEINKNLYLQIQAAFNCKRITFYKIDTWYVPLGPSVSGESLNNPPTPRRSSPGRVGCQVVSHSPVQIIQNGHSGSLWRLIGVEIYSSPPAGEDRGIQLKGRNAYVAEP